MSFENKYLKYKGKDLSFKNLTGGAVAPIVPAPDNSFKPGISGSVDDLVEKIGRQDNMMAPNFQDSWIWEPRRLNEGVDFSLNHPWKNNNNDPEYDGMHQSWTTVTLIRDVYLTINNKKFVIKSGTPGDAVIINLNQRDIRKIIFSTHRIEFVSELVPESGCVLQ